MPFPAGVATTTCTFGNSYDGIGEGWTIEATVTLVLDGAKRLVWAATGDSFQVRPSERLKADAGDALSFDVAQVDQDGFTDGNGNEVTGWHYRLDWTSLDPSRRNNRNSGHIDFSPTSGDPDPLDLDNYPDGQVGTPVFVPQYATHDDLAVVQEDVDTHEADHNNPHAVTKAQVGLGNVTNDAQVAKAGDIMTGLLTLSGDPTSPLHAATRQYVLAQITALVNGAPGALDTLNELAAELQSDETAAGALTTLVGNLRNLSDSAFSTALSATIAAESPKALRSRVPGTGNYKAGGALVLQPFWAALANRNVAPVDIVHIGTSLWAGTGATDNATRLPTQLLSHLRKRYPVNDVIGGVGWCAGNGQYGGPTVAGTGTSAVNKGPGNRATHLTVSGDQCTYGSLVGTKVTIYGYANTASDSITYNIDSGTYTGTITPGVTGRFSQSITVARGSHLVVAAWAAGTPDVIGVNVNDGDPTLGIRMWDFSKGGSKSADWQTAYGGSQDWVNYIGSGALVDPDLIVLDTIPNDATTISAATHQTQVQALITLIRTVSSAPIVLYCGHRRNPAVTTTISPWGDYTTAAYTLAAGNTGVCVFDTDILLDITATGMSAWLNDTYHPNNLGYAALAAALFEFLAPAGHGSTTGMTTTPFTVTKPQEQVRGALRVYGTDAAQVPARIVPPPAGTVDIAQATSADQATTYFAVDKAGRTVASNLTARGGAALDGSVAVTFTVDSQAGFLRDIVWATTTGAGASPSARWIMRADTSAESGSNAGSAFLFLSRTDAGGTLMTIFSVVRSSGLVTWGDGVNFAVGSTTGTKIGTASTQKLAFYGTTPIVRPTATPAAATDAATTQTLVNDLRTKLLALGLIA